MASTSSINASASNILTLNSSNILVVVPLLAWKFVEAAHRARVTLVDPATKAIIVELVTAGHRLRLATSWHRLLTNNAHIILQDGDYSQLILCLSRHAGTAILTINEYDALGHHQLLKSDWCIRVAPFTLVVLLVPLHLLFLELLLITFTCFIIHLVHSGLTPHCCFFQGWECELQTQEKLKTGLPKANAGKPRLQHLEG
mmetsp:Transcript_27871/g.64757  ORF Transcript_27871/g.64757 Transcript_27871/m.64757 type:complete len:200 (+) Transcript_27871:99-698(+)